MPTFKKMLKTLTDKFQKTQKPMPPGQERMKRVQEAAQKVGEEVKPKT
jgi:hypothetical protein